MKMQFGFVCLLAAALLAGCSGAKESEDTVVNGDAAKETKVEEVAAASYPEEPVFESWEEQSEWSYNHRTMKTEQFMEAYEKFAIDTAAELLSGEAENMVYSPLSLYYALAYAADGAGGDTQAEMLALLGYEDVDSLAEDCKISFESLYHVSNEENVKENEYGEYPQETRYQLRIANSLWADDSLNLKEEFAAHGAEYYYADMYRGDLQSSEAADAMAQWVSEHTNGLLTPAMEPKAEEAMLSIMNTIYFYDEWMDRFDKEKTDKDTFTCTDGTEVACDFMNRTMGSHAFRKGEDYTMSALSLKNGSMEFYLPDEGVSVYDLAENLEQVLKDEAPSVSGEVVWKIPKFSYGANMSLVDSLKALGMEKAFEADADFAGISDDPLFISSINQDAHIGIDENGVEAAAFTEIMWAGAALPTDRADMILDRPFLYVVRNNGVIVFVGICENPEAE